MADKFQLKAIISAVDKLSPTLKGIRLQAKITRKSIGDISNATGSLATNAGITGAALAGGLFASVKKIINVSAEFERFQTILETIEGSSEKAKQSMGWIQQFAVSTPYELQEVTDSFVKLKAYGIDPTDGSLKSTGNAAAAMGKSVMQGVEALADAMTGENERLKEFGIKASKAGDLISYSWTENGKSMVATAKASSKEQIQAVITGIWNRRFDGAMDKLSGTWGGLWSNMLDQTTKFIKKIGDSGFFAAAKKQLGGLLGQFNKLEDNKSLDRLAKLISDDLTAALASMVKWIETVDWAKFYQGLKDTVTGIRDFISSIGGLKTLLILFGVAILAGPVAAIFQIIMSLFTLGKVILATTKIMMGFALANPVLAVIVAVIVVIAGLAYLVYKNWVPIKAFFLDLWVSIKAAFTSGWELIKTIFSYSPLGLILKSWGPVLKFFSGLWDKVKDVVSATPSATGTPSAGNALAPSSVNRFGGLNKGTQLNGEMVVKFENAPAGMRVNAGKTNQAGVAMNPDVGYSPFVRGL